MILMGSVPTCTFDSKLGRLIFTASRGATILSLAIKRGRVLSRACVPSTSNQVAVGSLRNLVRPCLTAGLVRQYDCQVASKSSRRGGGFAIRFYTTRSSVPTTSFVTNCFLSALVKRGVATVKHGRFIRLIAARTYPIATAYICCQSRSNLSAHRIDLQRIASASGVIAMRISPRLLIGPNFRLIHCVVRTKMQARAFSLSPSTPSITPILLFAGSFKYRRAICYAKARTLRPRCIQSATCAGNVFHGCQVSRAGIFGTGANILARRVTL